MLTFLENLFRSPFLEKRLISLTLFGYFESIQLIQSYQCLKVNRHSHLLYGSELTQSPINSPGKVTESIQLILRKKMNRLKSINSVKLIGIQVRSGAPRFFCLVIWIKRGRQESTVLPLAKSARMKNKTEKDTT